MKFTYSIDLTNKEYEEFKRLEQLFNEEDLHELRLKDIGHMVQEQTHDLQKTKRFLAWFVLNGLQFSWLIDAMVKEP